MFDMDLILVDALAGAISGLVGFLIAKRLINREKHPQAFLLTLIVILVAGTQVIPVFLKPYLRQGRAAGEIDKLLDSDPIFRKALQDYPELRESLQGRLTEAYATGQRELSAEAGRTIIGPLVPAYLARAPDRPVVGFAQAQLHVMQALQGREDRCFRFANPAVDGAIVLEDDEWRKESYAAVQDMFLSAGDDPVVNDAIDGPGLLEGVSSAVYGKYGEQMGILATPQDPEIDRTLYCEVLISLYQEIVALPEPESAAVLRYIIGSSNQNAQAE